MSTLISVATVYQSATIRSTSQARLSTSHSLSYSIDRILRDKTVHSQFPSVTRARTTRSDLDRSQPESGSALQEGFSAIVLILRSNAHDYGPTGIPSGGSVATELSQALGKGPVVFRLIDGRILGEQRCGGAVVLGCVRLDLLQVGSLPRSSSSSHFGSRNSIADYNTSLIWRERQT